MRHFFLIPAVLALPEVKAHLFRATFEHFLHIDGDAGSLDLRWMEFGKGVVPIGKDLFYVFFASDQLHACEAGEGIISSVLKNARGKPIAEGVS